MDDGSLQPGYYTSALPQIRDWGKVVSFTPNSYFAPSTLDELQEFLTHILKQGRRLRILGGLHSCSSIFQDETVLDPTSLPLEFDVVPTAGGGGSVTASAHMHAHDFLARAAEHNLSLTATGGTDGQRLAGLISTNTAPASAHHSLYDTLSWIEYLAPAGNGFELRRVTKSDPQFLSLVCSLGAVGYITRVNFDLVPQRFFAATLDIRPIAPIVADPFAVSKQYDFWRIEWVPDTDHGLFWSANSIDANGVDPNADYPADKAEGLLKLAIGGDEALLKSGPFLNDALKAVYGVVAATYGTTSAKGPLRHMIPLDRLAPLHVSQSEWGFDPADLPKVVDVCRAYFGANKWPNIPIEIELCKTDNFHMSPWNWPGLPAIVKLNFQYLTDYLSASDQEAMMGHLKGLWDAFVAAGLRMKAHWGKCNFLSYDYVAKNYELSAFEPLVHPMFVNDYLRSRLLPAGQAS